MCTFTKYTKCTRSSPGRPDLATLPGTRDRGAGGGARSHGPRRRERDGGNCRTLGSKGGQVEKVLNRIESCDRHRNGTGRLDPKLEDRRSARPGSPEQFEGCGQCQANSSSAGVIEQKRQKPAQWPAMLGGVG